jgi:hypothetical protein
LLWRGHGRHNLSLALYSTRDLHLENPDAGPLVFPFFTMY